MNKNKPIDNERLIKYREGKLSPEEAYELERAALFSKFHEEAMEGLDSISAEALKADLASITRQIDKNKPSGSPLWKVAAVAALLILSGLSIFWLANQPANNEIALQKKEVEEEIISQKNTPQVESIEPTESGPQDDPDESSTAESPGAESSFDDQALDEIPITSDNQVSEKNLPGGTIIKNPQSSIAVDSGSSVLSENLSMSNQIRSFQSSDEEVIESLAESSYHEPMATEENSSVARQPEATFDEHTRAAGSAKNQVASDRQGGRKPPDNPYPTIGWDNYKKYLEENLQYPQEAIKNGISGTVKLSFVVKPDGTFENLRIKKSLGFGCDEEALRLIKEGPEWVGVKKPKKVKLEVLFE
ncbi:MAG TPA: energy transducer TonB [Cyclobacteriaceae bacterium]